MNIKKLNLTKLIKNILIFVLIFIICSSNILQKSINNLDEIWNYNFARNIADGLAPYRDFNMIVTPLLYFICGVILKILGNQLIVMRFLAILLMSSVFFMAFQILRRVTNSQIAIISLSVLLYAFKDIMCIDYNYAVLLIALLVLYIEIYKKNVSVFECNFRREFLIGCIAGLSILCKQTTGLAITIACIGYKILAVRNKDELKKFLKIGFIRLIGAIVPVLIFIIYLLVNNNLFDFLDYTVLGLKTFTNSIPYTSFMKKKLIYALYVPTFILIMFISALIKNKREVYVLFAYAISSFVVAFPITDKIHFGIGSLITFIASIYYFYCILKKYIPVKEKGRKIIYILGNFVGTFAILLFALYSGNIIINKYIRAPKEYELSHFYGIPENINLKKRILEVDNYINTQRENGKKVYILDSEAAIYNIPLNIYYKDYDMFNQGNLGAKGEDGIIERIKAEDNCVYLIKSNNINWQHPTKVREYVQNNLNLMGKISIFDIYQKSEE